MLKIAKPDFSFLNPQVTLGCGNPNPSPNPNPNPNPKPNRNSNLNSNPNPNPKLNPQSCEGSACGLPVEVQWVVDQVGALL